MADELNNTAEGTDPNKIGKVMTQEEINAIVERRLARDREKYADYDVVKKEAETLRLELQKRKEAELSEMEKIKLKNEEIALELETAKAKAVKYDGILEQVNAEVAEELETLNDEQKKVIDYISDPHAKLVAIRQFKGSPKTPAVLKGGKEKDATLEEINELKAKGGDWRKLWAKYRAEKKYVKGPFDF